VKALVLLIKKVKPYCYRLTGTFLTLALLELGEVRRFDIYVPVAEVFQLK
jgi:hypothetical protein